ncbi:hypothetical protein ACFOOM_18905 [Streptomyces echinoruber]|uniref:hypothetical protein n=1 Tax=Streptomyces echinoruber TaxID=68898 RepID=UPI001E40155E|nr:hypothetical protein [Streptomyces echinoruber]
MSSLAAFCRVRRREAVLPRQEINEARAALEALPGHRRTAGPQPYRMPGVIKRTDLFTTLREALPATAPSTLAPTTTPAN